MTFKPSSTQSSRAARLRLLFALIGSLALLVLAVIAFYIASRGTHDARQDDDAVVVHVHATGCTPDTLNIAAGRTAFRIVNDSKRAVEWEILDGVMVIEERENIAPGFTQTLSATLAPGQYAMTCGLLSNPRGTITVTATAESEAARHARPKLLAYVGALAEYRVYVTQHTDAMVHATQELVDAVSQARPADARAAYMSAYGHYAQLEPAAGAFSDLATRIDGQAAYFEQRERDPAYMGFRRIGAQLVHPDAAPELLRLTEALAQDAHQLRERLMATLLPPDRLAAGAARTITQLADSDVGDMTPDIAQMRRHAGVAGAHQVFVRFQDFIARRDAPLASTLAQSFDRLLAMDAITSEALRHLGESLQQVGGALGYE